MKKPLSLSKSAYTVFLCTLLCFTAAASVMSLSIAYKEHQTSLELMDKYNEAVEKISSCNKELEEIHSQQEALRYQLEAYGAILAGKASDNTVTSSTPAADNEGLAQTQQTSDSQPGTQQQTSGTQQASDTQQGTQQNQSVRYYVTSSGSKYHIAGCSYLKKSKIEITLSQAVAKGYAPCSRCMGK